MTNNYYLKKLTKKSFENKHVQDFKIFLKKKKKRSVNMVEFFIFQA